MTSRAPGTPVFYLATGILLTALAWTQTVAAQDQPSDAAGTTAAGQGGSGDEAVGAALPGSQVHELAL